MCIICIHYIRESFFFMMSCRKRRLDKGARSTAHTLRCLDEQNVLTNILGASGVLWVALAGLLWVMLTHLWLWSWWTEAVHIALVIGCTMYICETRFQGQSIVWCGFCFVTKLWQRGASQLHLQFVLSVVIYLSIKLGEPLLYMVYNSYL